MRTRENVEDAIVQAVLALGGGVGRDADGVTAAIRVHGGVVGVSVHWSDTDAHEAPTDKPCNCSNNRPGPHHDQTCSLYHRIWMRRGGTDV